MNKMKRYKHIEDGYIVEAEEPSGSNPANINDLGAYHVRGYYGYRTAHGKMPDGYLAKKDFEKLFEPIEEFCCHEFKQCMKSRAIRSLGTDLPYYCYAMKLSGEIEKLELYSCPFCKTKL